MKKVCVIVGPTGSGKSKLSIEVAKAFSAEIINSDSVQMYQSYDIGSAKIQKHDMQGIKHHMLSFVEPNQDYDVSKFQKQGREVLQNIDFPIVCGGTGLYIKALLYDYQFIQRESVHDTLSLEDKINYIFEHDPKISLDVKNERRVESAYQIIRSGQKRSELIHKDFPLYDIYTIYLDIDRTLLKDRLKVRLDKQLEDGFIDEVKALKQTYGVKPFIGYKEVDMFLDDEISFEEMKEHIILKTMKFAKKQKTWFKNQMPIQIYDALDDELVNKVIKDLSIWLK